ncbi:outer membrane autotransporter protein [Hydrogenophaga palleronii]|uniref:Outer membrane autotransporter protein n=1 Tax=Hydrogenophaga palleronii TaxID=65655 RepID=A0ABU1WSZ0_9BURK|nr:autotransporter domain-containing protein [Hydrogenophaga palleronii]MDR7152421.1 outer membrane autotransporter protein [Hydrogenophaga palleronii]
MAITGSGVLSSTTDGVVVQPSINDVEVSNEGSINVFDRGVYNEGSIDDLSNHGEIRGNVAGVLNDAGGSISQFNNHGTHAQIFSFGPAISNAGHIGQLDNTGRIESSNNAIVNEGQINRIDNAGVISAGVGIINRGEIGVIDNAAGGEITGSGGFAILSHDADSRLATINNAGLIDGGIHTLYTTLNIEGTSSSITGPVINRASGAVGAGDGSVNVRSGAVFTTSNTFHSHTFVIHNGGRLRIGASAHTLSVDSSDAAAFRNAGTLEVPEGTVANITGHYSQSGVLRIGASSDASYGRLNVSGSVQLSGSAQFDVDVNATNTLAVGHTLSGVIVSGDGVTNNAPANNVTDNSALFNFESATNGNAVDLEVVAAGSPTPAPAPAPTPGPTPAPAPAPEVEVLGLAQGIVPAVIQHGLLNGVPVAQVLDGYIRGGATGSDFDNVVTALGKLPSNRTVALAVGQLMPSMHGNAALAGLAHSASSGSLIEQRAELGQSGGSEAGGRGLWIKPVGNWVHQDAVGSVSGFKVASYGLMGGVQSDLNARSTLGFGLGYLQSKVDGQDFAASHSSDIDGVQLAGYGHHTLNEAGWQLNWQGDYTRSRVESQRHLGFIGRTAEGKYDADAWHVGVGISRSVAVAPNMTFKPMASLDWRRFKSEAYTETGAGALSLQTQSQKAEEAILKFGAQIQGDLGSQSQWLARAALGYDLSSQHNAVTARFTGGGAAFTTVGLPHSRTVAELGVGLRYRPTEGMEVIARYDLALRKGLRDQRATVRLSWSF